MLLVTRVAGDGDCLFHALGLPDSYDGNALRIEVADFMEARAPGLPAADQQLWLLEAEKLRGNRWAGHTAAVAYSAFKQRRVLIHQRRGEGAAPRVEDATHASVPPTAPLQHILYNGADHYDALVEVSTIEGLVPAWEQPPPPAYFEHPNAVPFAAGSFPALASSRARQPKRPSAKFAAPRPAKKTKAAKAKAAGATKTPPAAQPEQPAAPEPARGADDEEMGEEEEERGAHQLLHDLAAVPVAPASAHPHRRAEDLIQDGLRESQAIIRDPLQPISLIVKLTRAVFLSNRLRRRSLRQS